MGVVSVAAAKKFAKAFVPIEVRESSLAYSEISSVSALSYLTEPALATATRELDHPDIPFTFSAIKSAVNLILDLLLTSQIHDGYFQPSVNMQTSNGLACDLSSAFARLVYSAYLHFKGSGAKAKTVDTEYQSNQGDYSALFLRRIPWQITLGPIIAWCSAEASYAAFSISSLSLSCGHGDYSEATLRTEVFHDM